MSYGYTPAGAFAQAMQDGVAPRALRPSQYSGGIASHANPAKANKASAMRAGGKRADKLLRRFSWEGKDA